ncbi:MAG: Hpt domain-containing protein [Treponema sp.]|nr:Hpt domain-containing protein [Treponema sp.]MBR4004626.1 Hpt domain-containing protein [Treponema sp.]
MQDVEINQESAMGYTGGDRDLYLSILEVFRGEKDETQKKLNAFLQAEDWNNYEIIVHALKGNALMVGCTAFSELSKSLEFACKDIMAGNDVEQKVKYVKETHPQYIEFYDALAEKTKGIA